MAFDVHARGFGNWQHKNRGDVRPPAIKSRNTPNHRHGSGNLQGRSGLAPPPSCPQLLPPLLASDVTGTTETETGECQGYIDSEADHYLTLEHSFQYLKVLAESDSPTSLAILGPKGEAWCHTGSNPYIEGVWDAGEYQVYLANLEEADVGDRYELLVTEID